MARETGLRRYSRLTKSELLRKLVGNEEQILDRENDAGMANVPFLTPTPYTPPQATPSSSSSSSSNDVKDLIDYLNKKTRRPKNLSHRSVTELKLKKLLKEIDDINKRNKNFEVKETDSALKKFAKVYTIDGEVGFDPQSFLDGARENMVRALRDNRNTKVKLFLICYMDFPSRNENPCNI